MLLTKWYLLRMGSSSFAFSAESAKAMTSSCGTMIMTSSFFSPAAVSSARRMGWPTPSSPRAPRSRNAARSEASRWLVCSARTLEQLTHVACLYQIAQEQLTHVVWRKVISAIAKQACVAPTRIGESF